MQALVLDGNSSDCATTMENLRQAGYQPLGATSLIEAREALEYTAFDVMLFDLSLEDSTNLPLCAEIRERFGEEPIVIFLSSNGSIDQRILGLDLGADDVIGKPYDRLELLARIEARRRRRARARKMLHP